MMTKTVRGDDLSEQSAEEAEQVTRDPLRINEELGPASDKGESGEWRSCETWRFIVPPNPLKIVLI